MTFNAFETPLSTWARSVLHWAEHLDSGDSIDEATAGLRALAEEMHPGVNAGLLAYVEEVGDDGDDAA